MDIVSSHHHPRIRPWTAVETLCYWQYCHDIIVVCSNSIGRATPFVSTKRIVGTGR